MHQPPMSFTSGRYHRVHLHFFHRHETADYLTHFHHKAAALQILPPYCGNREIIYAKSKQLMLDYFSDKDIKFDQYRYILELNADLEEVIQRRLLDEHMRQIEIDRQRFNDGNDDEDVKDIKMKMKNEHFDIR